MSIVGVSRSPKMMKKKKLSKNFRKSFDREEAMFYNM
jgi:hypothetical protein